MNNRSYITSITANLLQKEKEFFVLLFPLSFILGSFTYFAIHFEPSLAFIGKFLTISVVLNYILYAIATKRLYLTSKYITIAEKLFYPTVIITFFLIGFCNACYQTQQKSKNPIIEENLGVIWLRGTVEKIEYKENFVRLLLSDIDLWQPERQKFHSSKTPKKVRINSRTKIAEGLEEGDFIQTKVILSPPPRLPVFPDSYDFFKVAFFDELGAVGYSISEIKIRQKNNNNTIVSAIRKSIRAELDKHISDKDKRGIIKALIIGDRSDISEDTYQIIRDAGLGHLLAISGMHMSILMFFTFVTIRFILLLFLKNHSPILSAKKIASIFGICLGMFYLLISNTPISAIRAYVMLCVFFLSILLDREAISQRSVFIAAVIILCLQPHAILSVSFQMSFMAVVGLVGFYNYYTQNFYQYGGSFGYNEELNIRQKVIRYMAGICITTAIVSFATIAVTLFNFNYHSKYSSLANIIAIPLVTFLILPISFVASLLIPLGIDGFLYKTAAQMLDIVLYIANYVANISGNKIHITQYKPEIVAVYCFSLLLFFIIRGKVRYYFLYLNISLLFYVFFIITPPKFVINQEADLMAIKQQDDLYAFIGNKRKSFVIKIWQEALALNDNPEFFNKNPNCSLEYCRGEGFLVASAKTLHGIHRQQKLAEELHNIDFLFITTSKSKAKKDDKKNKENTTYNTPEKEIDLNLSYLAEEINAISPQIIITDYKTLGKKGSAILSDMAKAKLTFSSDRQQQRIWYGSN